MVCVTLSALLYPVSIPIQLSSRRINVPLFVGMSTIDCDEQVLLNSMLEDDVINNMYVYQGAAARIATNYRYSSGNYIPLEPEEQGFLID